MTKKAAPKKAAPRKATAKKAAAAQSQKTHKAAKPAPRTRQGKATKPRKPAGAKGAPNATKARKPGTAKRAAPKKAARAAKDRGTGGTPEQQGLFAPDPKIADILDERLLVPQRVAALAFGISVEALKKWRIKARHKRGRESLYYLPELIAHRIARADQAENSLMADRSKLARVQAEKVELEIAQLRGQLIPADVILENWTPLVGAARQKVLGIPTKIKTQIPGLTDDQVATIQSICRSTLEDLANAGLPKSAKHVTRATV